MRVINNSTYQQRVDIKKDIELPYLQSATIFFRSTRQLSALIGPYKQRGFLF